MNPAQPRISHQAFTVRYNGRVLRLTSDVQIFPAFRGELLKPTDPQPKGLKYTALYDTGATHSAVTPRVVADLKLPSIGARNVNVGGGTIPVTSHLINIGLPNRVMFQHMTVASMILQGFDVIIGMDVLGIGDFTVTHHQGKTTFSFCCPSRREIDFVAEVQDAQKPKQVIAPPAVGRNSRCPCGSGKKYKQCCGK